MYTLQSSVLPVAVLSWSRTYFHEDLYDLCLQIDTCTHAEIQMVFASICQLIHEPESTIFLRASPTLITVSIYEDCIMEISNNRVPFKICDQFEFFQDHFKSHLPYSLFFILHGIFRISSYRQHISVASSFSVV